MEFPQALYRTALRALRVSSPAMMGGRSKLARGLRGRRDAHRRLTEWGRRVRSDGDGDRPLVWVHASSVGEALQARAVADVLRQRTHGLRVVFTFFSPSAERLSKDSWEEARDREVLFPSDISSYLPWDLPGVVGPVLDAVRPTLLMFTQREVWPTLAEEARARGVPAVLVGATLPEGAGRLSTAGRLLLGPAFRSLRTIAAVSDEDAGRFGLLGVRGDRVTVTGDPAVDAARDRVSAIDRRAPHMRVFGDAPGPILVAGSTWPSDEEVLVPALAHVRESLPALRVVLVPHEPDGCDFGALGRALAADGWAPALLGEVEEGAVDADADVVLVDRVGVLAELYCLASVAYVGGGFDQRGSNGTGLHSVLEPAAAGVPAIIGPRYEGSVHAARLVAAGAARSAGDAKALAHAMEEWLGTAEKNEDARRRAMAYIEKQRGSAERTADLIAQFLPRQDRRGTLSEGKT